MGAVQFNSCYINAALALEAKVFVHQVVCQLAFEFNKSTTAVFNCEFFM